MKLPLPSSSRRPGRLATLLAAGTCAVLFSACQRDPNRAKQTYFDAANKYFAQQKYDEAVIEYRNALKYDPKFGEARYKLGQAYARTGDAQNAFREYVRAADLMPDNADVQLMAGRFLLINRQFEDARGRAQRVLGRDQRNVDAQILLGNAMAGLRDLDGAIAEMQTALEIDPARAGTYTTLGQMQRAQGDVTNAEETFKKAVAMAPKSLNARLALGQERLRQPLADIAFAARPPVTQPIEAEPRRDGREIGLERAQRILWLGIMQAHEGVLHDLFGVSPVASDPVGQREHGRTQLGEGAIEGHAVWTFWAVRTRCIASFAWCHDTRRRPGQKKKPGTLRSILSA